MGKAKIRVPSTLRDAELLSREELIAAAHHHAQRVAYDRGDYGWTAPPGSDERLVVNMLRHRCTGYDSTEQTASDRSSANFRIAARFPWLAAECHQQDAARQEQDDLERQAAADYELMQQQAKLRRQQWSAESKAAIKAGVIGVGAAVEVRIRGHQRLATVTAVARSKATVSYQIKSGEQRTETLYACWCKPVDATAGGVA